MKSICKNCGEFFAFHGARAPHDCPITESHAEPSSFEPRMKHAAKTRPTKGESR